MTIMVSLLKMRPEKIDDIGAYINNANVHLSHAANFVSDNARQVREAARPHLWAVAQLLDGLLTFQRDSPAAAFFENGDAPTPALRLESAAYDFTTESSIQIPAREIVEIRMQHNTNWLPHFGFIDYVSTEAMARAVKHGGKFVINETGVEDWFKSYSATADYILRFGNTSEKSSVNLESSTSA